MSWYQRPWVRVLLGVAAVIGGLVAAASAWIGQCAAFGGTCPADPPPLLQDDVFGGVLVGLAMLTVGGILAVRPDRRGVATAAVVMILVVLPVAYAVARSAHQGF